MPTQAPPSRSNAGVIVAIVAVALLLLVLVGAGVAGFVYYRASASASALPVPPPTASATATAPASAPPTAATIATTATATATSTAATPGGAKKPVTPVPVADAGPPPSNVDAGARKAMAGTNPDIRGGSFGKYDIEKTKASVRAVMPAIRACYVATELDPPDHQFTIWVLVVDPAGNVKTAHRKTDYELHPKFDACIMQALRLVKLEALPGGGEIDITLVARTKDNP